MSAHVHGGGGAFNGQRQPVIESLEFGNVFAVADGLAHGATIPVCRRFSTLPGLKLYPFLVAGTVVTIKSFSRSVAGA
jgi:hypothetical protein